MKILSTRSRSWTDRAIPIGLPATLLSLLLQVPTFADQRSVAQTRGLQAALRVDWSTDEVRLSLAETGPISADLMLDITALGSDKRSQPILEQTADSIQIAGAAEVLLALLVPETRSLWIHDTDHRRVLRADLPPPKIVGVRRVRENPSEQSSDAVDVSVTGLFPSFRILVSEQSEESDTTRFDEISNLTTVKIESVDSRESESIVRLELSGLAGRDEIAREFRLVFVNPDGSRSRSLQLSHDGRRIKSEARLSGTALLAPVDADALVPSVELLRTEDAFEELRSAGFVPIVVDDRSLNVIDPETVSDAIVMRQGLEPHRSARQGQEVVLSVSNTTAEFESETRGSRTPSDASISVGETLGFVDLPAVKSTLIGSSLGADSKVGPRPESAADMAGETPPDVAAIIRVPSDPGICINPKVSRARRSHDAAVKLLSDGLSETGSRVRLPGPIGDALLNVHQIVDAENGDRNGGQYLEGSDAEAILESLLNGLDVSLSDEDQKRAVAEWQRQRVASGTEVVEEALRQDAIDAAVWFLTWLYEQDRYDPATVARVQRGALGGLVGLLSSKPHSTTWLDGSELLGRLSESDRATRNGLSRDRDSDPPNKPSGGATNSEADKEPKKRGRSQQTDKKSKSRSIPKGPSSVKEDGTPDKVRVPNWLAKPKTRRVFAGQQVPVSATRGQRGTPIKKAVASLRELGLRPKKGRFYKLDRVVESNPKSGDWVTPDRRVDLTVWRKVPDLAAGKQPLGVALEVLAERDFRVSESTRSHRKDDVVVDQKPKGGRDAYAPLGTQFSLTVERGVPDLVGMTVERAISRLRELDFRAVHYSDYSDFDTVLAQEPPSGTLRTGSSVRLTLRRPIPNVAGKDETTAKRVSEAIEILRKHKLKTNAISGDSNEFVLSQSPDSTRAFRLEPEFDAAKNLVINLTPGVGVPPVNGLPLDEARSRLEWLQLKHDVANDDAHSAELPRLVISQDVAAGVIVAIGSTIRLQVGLEKVAVPDVVNKEVGEAKRLLARAGLRARFNVGDYLDSDQVKRQRPPRQRRVDAGTEVLLDPIVRYLPNVVQLSWPSAVEYLEAGGFRVEHSPRQVPVEAEVVLAQIPKGDRLVPVDSTIRLTPGVLVPSLERGLSEIEAARVLRAKGLHATFYRLRRDTQRESDRGRSATTGRSNPAPGVAVRPGSAVRVEVVNYLYRPAVRFVTVPPVAPPGLNSPITCNEAVARLRQVGLVAKVVHVSPEHAPPGGHGSFQIPDETPTKLTAFLAPPGGLGGGAGGDMPRPDTVIEQFPLAGARVPIGYIVKIACLSGGDRGHPGGDKPAINRRPLVSYATFGRVRAVNTAIYEKPWRCELSADRSSVSITVDDVNLGFDGEGGQFGGVGQMRGTGTLVDSDTRYQGELCMTYSIQGLEQWGTAGLRIPANGQGYGQVNVLGRWQSVPVEFSLRGPRPTDNGTRNVIKDVIEGLLNPGRTPPGRRGGVL